MSVRNRDHDEPDIAAAAASRGFFTGATQIEALARLEYLVETGHRCGLLTGPKGTGKSLLLRAFADQCAAARGASVLLNVTGMDSVSLLRRLTEGLGATSHAAARLPALWTEVTDSLAGQRRSSPTCVVMFDDLDLALHEGRQVVRRLLAQNVDPNGATFVLAFSGQSYPVVAREWRQSADLRIELGPLTAEETGRLAQSFFESLGLSHDVLDPIAADALFRMTRGNARDIVRLCELSLLSALDEEKTAISGDVVEAAMRELAALRPSA